MKRFFKAGVKENTPLNKNHFLLTFAPLEEAPEPRPGQFYMVAASGSYDPLLKRPFCFFRKTDLGIQMLYRIKGKGTKLLSGLKTGDVLDVLGPLGNSYPMPPKKDTALVVAGGIGIASLFPLIEALEGRAHVIYGARTKNELLMLDEVKALSMELAICTDDGTCGGKGTVMDFIEDIPDEGKIIYCCGPLPMLRAVSEFASKRGIKGYVSLEENMACGLGACLGCAVKMTSGGYKRVCKEGPVFKMEEVGWER
ncbi:MAG: dihydroorotate dehydrogenase electron transfer subunit [Thermodesulfovibrionales bacterium]|nr:dihydroorotate dehydrogenase electron transfer subunit [Thermodesulfovibrionales bacterium]